MEFNVSYGLRQEDPLSPFLFLIVMEALKVSMESAKRLSLFNGIKLPNNKPHNSHLFNADDVLFLGEFSKRNILSLSRILICFEISLGLRIHFLKSTVVGVGSDLTTTSQIASMLSYRIGSPIFSYPGLPVGYSMYHLKIWKPLVDKVTDILYLWKQKTLSIGGRITLIKSVLGSLPLYYMSLYHAPISVINSLKRIRRDFCWGASGEKSY